MTPTDLRKQYNMSQREFAAYFGIPRRTVENWDSGTNQTWRGGQSAQKGNTTMKIIKVWVIYCGGDWTYHYSRASVMQELADIADDVRCQVNDYTGLEAASAMCFYAPIKDGVTLPEDPSDLYLCEDGDWDRPLYLHTEHTDITMEHEFPLADCIVVDGSGEITTESDGVADPHGYIPRWKAAGWNGVVEEVIL